MAENEKKKPNLEDVLFLKGYMVLDAGTQPY